MIIRGVWDEGSLARRLLKQMSIQYLMISGASFIPSDC